MPALAALFALLAAVAGWYYLFYSKAAQRLSGIEATIENRRRQRYRRANGAMLFLLGGTFYAGFNAVDARQTPRAFLVVWMVVFVLLLIVLTLVVIDMRLTARLRKRPGR